MILDAETRFEGVQVITHFETPNADFLNQPNIQAGSLALLVTLYQGTPLPLHVLRTHHSLFTYKVVLCNLI